MSQSPQKIALATADAPNASAPTVLALRRAWDYIQSRNIALSSFSRLSDAFNLETSHLTGSASYVERPDRQVACGGMIRLGRCSQCPAFRCGHVTTGHDEFRDIRSPYHFHGLKNPLRQAAYPIPGFVPVVIHPSLCTCASFAALAARELIAGYAAAAARTVCGFL